jgi:hypothetical protein
MPKTGDLKVWWVPQVPMKPFEMPVKTLEEGTLLLWTLAQYDLFQLENNVKPDFSNAGGLCEFVDGEWSEWEDGNGDGIDELIDFVRETGRFDLKE